MRYQYFKYLITVSFLLHTQSAIAHSCTQGNTVTQQRWTGRLGDQIALYAKAKWFSQQYHVPLLCRAFQHSDEFLLADVENIQTNIDEKQFSKVVNLDKIDETFKPDKNTLYVMGFYTNMSPAWYQQPFIDELKKLLQPRTEYYKIPLPNNAISVAVHVRRGGGFDGPLLSSNPQAPGLPREKYMDVLCPLRFPPDSYYIEQINKVAELYNNRTLYVYIFTDDKNPAAIVKKYSEIINKPNIIWNYKKNNSDFNTSTLEDFFNMQRFDCLIRSESHFSIWVQRLGNFKVVIFPLQSEWQGDTLIINKTGIEINQS